MQRGGFVVGRKKENAADLNGYKGGRTTLKGKENIYVVCSNCEKGSELTNLETRLWNSNLVIE